MQKEPKKSSPARSSAGRAGQRTWRAWKFVKIFCYRADSWSCCFVLLETHKGAVFFVCLIKDVNEFSKTKKKALEHY